MHVLVDVLAYLFIDEFTNIYLLFLSSKGWSKSTSHNMVLGDLPLSIAPSTETETEKKVGIIGDLSSASVRE